MSFFNDDRASELKDLFFESAGELLQTLNEDGLLLEKRPGDAEVVRQVRRTVHTLKGDSAACGYTGLSSLAHELEDALTPEIAKKRGMQVAEVVLQAADVFQKMLDAYRKDKAPPSGEALLKSVKALVSDKEKVKDKSKPAAAAEVSKPVVFAPAFQWSEYERVVLQDALKRKLKVSQIALKVDPNCKIHAVAYQMAKTALQDLGNVLVMVPDEDTPVDSVDVFQAAVTTSFDADYIAKKCRIPAVISDVFIEPTAAPEKQALGASKKATAAKQKEVVVEPNLAAEPLAPLQEDLSNPEDIINPDALTSSLTLDDVLKNLMDMVVQSFQPDTWSLLLVDEAMGDLYFEIATGPAAETLKKMRIKLGEGIAGWVAAHAEAVIVPDVYSDPRFAKRIDEMVKFKTRSIICVPMRFRQRVLGVIQLINCPTEKFDAKKMNFLQTLCDYAAVGIENVRTAEATPGGGQDGAAALASNFLRVDADKIDDVLNLVGEMIIGKSMLTQTISEFDRHYSKDPLRTKFADALAFQARVLTDLQKSVMKIRMVPVDQLFRRFPRVVRDVSKACNKEVHLAITGQDTDLDKSILDMLAEPLSHLVRNAIGHGIGTPAERHTAGKPASGTIRLDAYHQGNSIVIEVSDDGRGIDRQKVVAKAIERGLIIAEEAARLTDGEALNLIFHPGLSTADEVTAVSGRGVGMDVVKSIVERLKGSVSIESRPGYGTTFFLRVPLTLAIIKALMFRVGDKLYAVPLTSVVEITRAQQTDVHRVDQHDVIKVREEVLTLVRLNKLHRIDSGRAQKIFVVIIQLGDRKFGLVVDRLVGEEELVIKALDDQLVATEYVSGASILGDGTVVLILNLHTVVNRLGRVDHVEGLAQEASA